MNDMEPVKKPSRVTEENTEVKDEEDSKSEPLPSVQDSPNGGEESSDENHPVEEIPVDGDFASNE